MESTRQVLPVQAVAVKNAAGVEDCDAAGKTEHRLRNQDHV